MKHIFYVHSHITFLVSKQYVFDKGINPDDCMFLCSRNYIPNIKYQQIFNNIKNYPHDIFGKQEDLSPLKNILNGFRSIYIVENFVKSFCQDDKFIYYPFSTYSHLCSMMVTMDECDGYYIIEEGSSAYYDNTAVRNLIGKQNLLFQSILVHFLPRFYLTKNHHFSTSSKKYKGTIATSNKAFSQIEGKHIVVSNPFDKETLPIAPTTVLSIDVSFYVCKIDMKYVIKILKRLHDFIVNNNKESVVAYKFHPILIQENAEKPFRNILSSIFNDVCLIELAPETSIENILNQYHCDFYSDWSSVGIYANQMGCTCYSYALRLSQISNNEMYASSLHRVYGILKEQYIQLD